MVVSKMPAKVRFARARNIFLPLCALFLCSSLLSAQEHASTKSDSSVAPTGELRQVESLFRNGQVPEAKSLVQTFLESHRSSVDGFNLLGIICSSEHDYECSTDALHKTVLAVTARRLARSV